MKCALILFALFALGYSVPLTNRAFVHIDVSDDAIVIDWYSGGKLIISRTHGYSGHKNIEVLYEDKAGSIRRIPLDHENYLQSRNMDTQYWQGLTEADYLLRIFKDYQGNVDFNTYHALLRHVYVCCQKGHINLAVFHVMKCMSIVDVSFDMCMSWGTHSASEWSPKWYSGHQGYPMWLNHLRHQQPFYYHNDKPVLTGEVYQNDVLESQHGFDKERNTMGLEGYLRQWAPEYYGHHLNAHQGQLVEPAQYQPSMYQQARMWQHPWNQEAHQGHWKPQQLNHYYYHMNAPVVY